MSAPIRCIGECARAQSKDVIAEVSNHFLDLASCRRQPLSESRISCQPDRHLKIQAHPEQGLKGSFVQFPLQLLPDCDPLCEPFYRFSNGRVVMG